MYGIVIAACRFALHVAERIVPSELRGEWRTEWLGDLWHWTLRAANSSAPDARFALLTHTREAVSRRFTRAFE